jgi:predicted transcriptional regulator
MKSSEIRLFRELSKGKRRMKDLALSLNVSKGFLSRLIKGLIKKNLVQKVREEGKNYYKISDSAKSILILRLILSNPNILKGKREILIPFLIEKKSLKELQIETGISLKQLIEYLKEFQSQGIVVKKGEKYFLNPEKHELVDLARILKIERNKEIFIWKKGNEYLKIFDKPNPNLVPTAFSVFSKLGVEIVPDKLYYYFPKKDLSIEEIFVHSLVFSSTKHQTFLSIIFFLKNKERMDLEKIHYLAKKYNVKEFLQKIFDYLDKKKVEDERFLNPKEFEEKARLYGAKLEVKESEKDKLLKLFKKIDKRLSKRVRIYLIGGANMVLRDLKISTKDIDIIVEKKNYKILKNTLVSLGLSFSHNIFKSKDYRVDVFMERILGGYFLSKRIKKKSETFIKLEKLKVMLVPLEYVFLFKSYAGREIDLEDCKILAEKGLNWRDILKENLLQEKELNTFLSINLLDVLDELNFRYKIKSPIIRSLDRYCTKKLIEISLRKKGKTVKSLVFELEKPESTVRKILKEMMKEKRVKRIKKGRTFVFMKISKTKA